MSEPRLISPLLDNFMMGGPISDHHGVCCCPAMENGTDSRYIVKVISVPASPAKMDALLLSGAYTDESSALNYFKELADDVLKEVEILKSLAELEGFIPFVECQLAPMESGKGYEIYLLGSYKRTLFKHFKRHSFTHLDALNLGLDMCAALSTCRRNGYLYVDLKPSNIFVTNQRLFRIGDLGFISLDSLKYASLPEKYLSIYTPPEVRDAFSSLNTTMDVYAAGLILYQTYNNNELPFNDEILPGDKLPAPLYADYEMSEIILKACDPNPENRWQTPIEMGQAIVSYMQRNGAMDTPIVPMPVHESEEAFSEFSEQPATEEKIEEVASEEIVHETADLPQEDGESTYKPDEIENATESDNAEEKPEEEFENLSFFDEISEEDDEELDEIEALVEDYNTITDEVSDMLNQADELAALDVPEPVTVPNYVEVPMPEPIKPEEETETDERLAEDEEAITDDFDEDGEEFEEEPEDTVQVKNFHWLRNCVIALVVIALLAAGIYYYKNHYLLPIEFIAVEGNEDSLTVLVTTDIDESLLQVICSDTYGNKIPAPVINGKAEFSGLVPNTAYSIKVVASGFHRLTGKSSTAYSTPIQSNIVQFDAVSGSTEDSVILSFTIEGPSCDEWTVLYATEGEDQRFATFADSHMVTLSNLTVGKAYTFQLVPKQALYLTGQTQIIFTPRKLIRAENLHVTSCIDNSISVKWSTPVGENISGWSVRCHNENYSQTIITTENTATFKDLDHKAEYDIEVKAVGMSVGEKITIPANSVTVTNYNINVDDPTKFVLTWTPSQAISEDGWVLRYRIIGVGADETITCTDNTATIESLIPNSTYRIQLEDIKGNILLGSIVEVTTSQPVDFQGEYGGLNTSRADFTFSMVKTPNFPNWGRYNLSDDDYRTEFSIGESASFLVRSKKNYDGTNQNVTVMYIIRNQAGAPIITSQQIRTWGEMWQTPNCKLEIPTMPAEVGNYSIEIFFNGGLANVQAFTIK